MNLLVGHLLTGTGFREGLLGLFIVRELAPAAGASSKELVPTAVAAGKGSPARLLVNVRVRHCVRVRYDCVEQELDIFMQGVAIGSPPSVLSNRPSYW